MSEVLGSMTGLELRQDSAGREYWYDKDEKKRVSVRIALGHMGVDPNHKQQPVRAIYHATENDDFPVTIVGFHDRKDNEDLLKAKETLNWIPRSKLTFLGPEIPADEAEYIRELEDSNRMLQSQNETLTADNERLAAELATVKANVARLEREFKEFRIEYGQEAQTEQAVETAEPEVKAVSPEKLKDTRIFPGSLVDVDWPAGEKGWGLTAVSGIWKGPDGKEHITYMNDEGPRWAPLDNVSIHEDSWETEPAATVPLESITPAGGAQIENTPLTWRERMSDWFTLRRPVTYLQTRRVVGGGPEDVEEVEVTEERTSAAAYAGGLILAAVLGGVIAWELKNNGHSHTKEFHTIINQNNHLKTEVHSMHQTLDQDSKVITQNHDLLNENHRILKHNRAVLKHLHEQVHHLFKIEKAESARELSAAGPGGGEAQLSFYGDTVWHETARRLNHASAAQIRKATDYVLRINGLRWNGGGSGVDAHKLPLGFTFRIPKNIVQIINR